MLDLFDEDIQKYQAKQEKDNQIQEAQYYQMAMVLENLFNTKEVKDVREKIEKHYLGSLPKPKDPMDAFQEVWFRRGVQLFFTTVDFIIEQKRLKDAADLTRAKSVT